MNKSEFLVQRQKVLDIFASEVYGDIPPAPKKIEALEKAIEGRNYFCGHARLLQVNLNCTLDDKTNFSFSFKLCLPTNVKKNKIIILINFTPNVPDKYCPAEEIIDMGWAFAALDYQSVTSDNNMPDGLARIYAPNGEIGKISLWAWAAMRIMDYLQTRDDIDLANIGVVGHSRLGKTALWSGLPRGAGWMGRGWSLRSGAWASEEPHTSSFPQQPHIGYLGFSVGRI